MEAMARMERPAAEQSEGRKELAAALFDLTQVQKAVTIQQISQEVSYSRSTISKFISGMYKGDEKEVERKLRQWYARYTGTEMEEPGEAQIGRAHV